MTPDPTPLRFGTRTSRLARWQTDHVANALRSAHPGLEHAVVLLSTEGDRDRQTPLPEIGGKGVFTEALEEALLSKNIDVAVHSLKDLPIVTRPELVVGAICYRVDPRDVLVSRDGWTLETLPENAVVGTSSTRRVGQLKALREDLRLEPLRGNVDTRVRKAQEGQYDAVCIAAAGLQRLQLGEVVSEYLPLDQFLPAPGQGALAIQCRADDEKVRQVVSSIDDPAVRSAVEAERSFLAGLGGGCAAPVGAIGEIAADGSALHLRGVAAAVDGSRAIRVAGSGTTSEPEVLGRELADDALEQGAAEFIT